MGRVASTSPLAGLIVSKLVSIIMLVVIGKMRRVWTRRSLRVKQARGANALVKH